MKELLQQVDEWPAFSTPDGPRKARVYEQGDGRRRVHIANPGEMRTTKHILNGDTTRLNYLRVGVNNDRAIFLGMRAKREHRGRGAGAALLDYFMENIEAQEDVAFVGTGRIHKPVIALCLEKAGFTPRVEDFVAELVPDEGHSDVPTIRIIKNDLDPDDLVAGNGNHNFYNVIPSAGVENHPSWAPNIVTLHTTYAPPQTWTQ